MTAMLSLNPEMQPPNQPCLMPSKRRQSFLYCFRIHACYVKLTALPSQFIQIRHLDPLSVLPAPSPPFISNPNLHNWHHLPLKRPPLPHPRPLRIRHPLQHHVVGIQIDKIPHRHHLSPLVADQPRPGVEDILVGDRRVELRVDLGRERVADPDAIFHRRGLREGEHEVLVLVLAVDGVVFWVEAREGGEGEGQRLLLRCCWLTENVS
jgi:hypothetical protein